MGRAELPGHRDAVVTVKHKIGLTDLVHLNRWHTLQAGDGALDLGPAALVAVFAGQKATRKVPITAHAADNSVQRDLLESLFTLAFDPQFFAHLFVGKQIDRFARQPGKDLLQRRLAARAAKILNGRIQPCIFIHHLSFSASCDR